MPEQRKQDILFRNNEEQEQKAVLHSIIYDSSERMTRALKMGGFFLLLAIVSVFIPLAHFVLVPSFVITAIVLPFMVHKLIEASEKAEGVCPSCHEQVTIKLDPKDKLPLWRYCPNCDKSLQLVKPAEQASSSEQAQTSV